jgi:hypothetical protein
MLESFLECSRNSGKLVSISGKPEETTICTALSPVDDSFEEDLVGRKNATVNLSSPSMSLHGELKLTVAFLRPTGCSSKLSSTGQGAAQMVVSSGLPEILTSLPEFEAPDIEAPVYLKD